MGFNAYINTGSGAHIVGGAEDKDAAIVICKTETEKLKGATKDQAAAERIYGYVVDTDDTEPVPEKVFNTKKQPK